MGYDFLSGVFNVLKECRLSVNVVTTTEASISLALASEKITSNLTGSLEKLGEVRKKESQGIISLIGSKFNEMENMTGYVFQAIPEVQISMISYSSDKKNLNIVLPADMLIPSVKAVHKKLFSSA